MTELPENKKAYRNVRPSVFEGSGSIFEVWEAEMDFTEWVCAGIPANGKAMAAWIRKNAGVEQTEEIRRMMQSHLEEIGIEIDRGASFEETVKASESASVEYAGQVYKRDGNGIYVESRQFKSMFKEAVKYLFANKAWGGRSKDDSDGYRKPKSATSWFAESVHTGPERIYFGQENADGINTSVVKTPMKKTSFTSYEYVENPTLAINVYIVEGSMNMLNFQKIWEWNQQNGFGARRSQGSGKFNLARWERVA